jgi:rRNA maturation protein Nop10
MEYLISYPEDVDDTTPTSTYAVDFDRLCVSRIDHGFWTFHTWYNITEECPRPTQLILSSAGDDALKEARFFDVFTRERWADEGDDWTLDQYETDFWSGALGFDLPDRDKRMVRMDVLAHTPADQTAGTIQLYVGHSNYPAEPVSYFVNCPITWYTLSSKSVPCAAATNAPVPWRFMAEGRYLYFRVKITGEACGLSRIVANVEAL